MRLFKKHPSELLHSNTMSSKSGLNQHLNVASEGARLRQRQLRGRRWGGEITYFRWVINQNCSSPVAVQHPPSHLSPLQKPEKSHCALAALLPNNLSVTSVCCVSANIPHAKPQGTVGPSLCKRKPFCPYGLFAVKGKDSKEPLKACPAFPSLEPFPRGSLDKKKPLRFCHHNMTLVETGPARAILVIVPAQTQQKGLHFQLQCWRHLELPRGQVTHEAPEHLGSPGLQEAIVQLMATDVRALFSPGPGL